MSRAFYDLSRSLIIASSTILVSLNGISPTFADDRNEWREGAAIEACEDVAESERARCIRKAVASENRHYRAQERMRKAHVDYQRQLADALMQDGAPRDMALAVLLRATTQLNSTEGLNRDDESIVAWRAQALAQGGDDPLVYALLLMARDGGVTPDNETSKTASAGQTWRDEALRRWRAIQRTSCRCKRLICARQRQPRIWASTSPRCPSQPR